VVIEASVNISRGVKTVKCSLSPHEAMDSSFYSLKEGSQERHGLSRMGEKDVSESL
jgi:hypothetical protein